MSAIPISADRPILLGSGSPRRRDLLAGLGLPFEIIVPDVDESGIEGESPAQFLERVVEKKLEAVLRQTGSQRFACALVADTIVVVDEEILGKPTDPADSERLLRKLCGRSHHVMTRYAVQGIAEASSGSARGQQVARTVVTQVMMRPVSDSAIQAYARGGEGADKAGSYAAQGVGAFLVEEISGSFTNVVGLPVCQLVQDLTEHGWLPDFPFLD